MQTKSLRSRQQGSSIIEYLVVLVFGLVVVWQTADVVMDNLIEHQEEYVHTMAQPSI